MKYAKKSILVPETEYHALLGILKGGFEKEKAGLDSQIRDTLENKKISEDIKGKKYEWLYKKRRQLNKEIENKPTKVVFDESQLKNIVSPYLGINQAPQSILKNVQHPLKITPLKFTSGIDISDDDDDEEEETFHEPIKTRSKSTKPAGPTISNKFHTQLKLLLQSNLAKFNIASDGQIKGSGNRSLKNTNYMHIVDYLTGRREEIPKGFPNLMQKLQQDNEYIDMVQKSKQIGAGKKRKRIVVKDIKRNSNTFRPKIWEKL